MALVLSACVPAQQYDALEIDYNQLNQRLSGEIGAQQVHISRLQGAIKVAVNSDLLFPSGSWQMPPQAAQLIAKMAPILAPLQQTTIIVTGYTDNTPIGPELILFTTATYDHVQINVACTSGGMARLQAFDSNKQLIATSIINLSSTLATVSVDDPNGRASIKAVKLMTNQAIWVADDLSAS